MLNKSLIATALVAVAAGALHAQTVTVDKPALTFYALSNGAAVTQTLTVSSTGGTATFGLGVTPQNSWLRVSTTQAVQTPNTITVTADPAGLAAGTQSGQIVVFVSVPTAAQPITVPVTFIVSNIGVSAQSLQYVYQQGGTFPAAQTLTLTGPQTSFNAAVTSTGTSWLQVLPTSGSSPSALTLSANQAVLAGFAPGTYTSTLTITPTSGSVFTAIVIPVTLTVTPTPPVTVTPTTINLAYQIGGLNNPGPQTVTLSTTGVAPVAYNLQSSVDVNPSNSNWIQIAGATNQIPAAGSTAFTIGYDSTKNLPASTFVYTGKVTVTSAGTPPQQDVNVRLVVSSTPLISVPGDTLAFNYQVGNAVPAEKTVTAISTAALPASTTGQTALTITATTTGGGSWLVVPSTGITGTPFSVSVNVTGLAAGSYSGAVSVTGTGAGNGAQLIPVTLVVANDPQVTATFSGCTNPPQACTLLYPVQTAQVAPAAQTVLVGSSTGAPLNYAVTSTAASCGASWIVLGLATTGMTDGSFAVSVNPAGIAAGTQCTGTINIAATSVASGASAPNSPLVIPISMYVSDTPLVSVSPAALTFSALLGAAQTAPKNITIAGTSAAEALNYSVAWNPASGGDGTWLVFGPSAGTTAAGLNIVTVLAQPGLLSPGTYTGNLVITATRTGGGAVADSPITIPVTFRVAGPALSVSPATLTFNQTAGGAAPVAQNVKVESGSAGSGQSFAWDTTVATTSGGNWLSVAPASGTSTPGSIAVSANGAGLTAGTYNGTVTVRGTSSFVSNTPTTVTVQLVVAPGTLSASVPSLSFVVAQGGTAANQTFTVSGSPASLSFTATAATTTGGPWLTVSPSNGNTSAVITVAVNGTGLAPGDYAGTVTITSAGATGSPKQVPVTLTVVASQTLTGAPATLSFSYTLTNPAPAAKTVQLTASGGAAQYAATATTASGGNWLSVTPASGSTPATLTITANPTGLAVGSYTGTIAITSPSSVTPVAASIAVTFTVAQLPAPTVTSVKNSASYAIGAISAGENVFIEGSNLGPAELALAQLTAGGTVATILAETQVTFDGIAAPIVYASALQTNVMVPYEVANRASVTMRVIYKGIQSDPVSLVVAGTAPGIYAQNSQGFGPGAIRNQDFAINGTIAPAAKGSVVQVYMTGEGLTTPTPVNGALAPVNGTGLYKPSLPVTATVGGIDAIVQYYGSSPGTIYGVMQVNVFIPATAPSGAVPIVIKVGTASTQAGITVAIQ